jgi:hypothetical protein
VAKLLEDRFPEVASTQPELLAHHYTKRTVRRRRSHTGTKPASPRRARRRMSKRSPSLAEAWRWSKCYRIRASGPSASWICKWRSDPPCT